MLRLLLILLGLGFAFLDCQAECDVCSENTNIACVSATEFKFCQDGLPAYPVNSCPTGRYCTTTSNICQKDASLSACANDVSDCGKCNDKKSFACTGVQTFALCLNSNIPHNITGSCPADQVCNKDNPQICDSATVFPATCSGSTIPLSEYCRNTFNGLLLHAVPNDTKCTSYVYCEFNPGTELSWVGRLIDCPTEKPYFNATKLSCGQIKPTGLGCT